jgi:uncharacterized membrane protein
MPCEVELLKHVPLFALLDDEERSVLASRVEVKQFAKQQRIYSINEAGGSAYVLLSGKVRVTTIDEDQQEVLLSEHCDGEFFGFASMLDGEPHQSTALALETSRCIEIDRSDIFNLIRQKPEAGMDMLAVLGKHFHSAQHLVRSRSMRNANEVIEEQSSFGDRVSDSVARFGGSWRFIISFGFVLVAYTTINILLKKEAWDPYPFILLNLFLSMLAAIQAPVIMMSQNRQDAKDRLRGELDFEVNRRAEYEIRALAGRLNDIEELIRGKLMFSPESADK